MRFLFFYLMSDEPGRVRRIAPDHAAYWQRLSLQDYEGGPFADRSGGLIVFHAAATERAHRIIVDDPFVKEGLLESYWVKEWAPHRQSVEVAVTS